MIISLQQSPLINNISSLKENALACALLRDEQVEVVSNFIEGHAALGVLPAGYGKRLCFVGSH